jgi:hypothetical protein
MLPAADLAHSADSAAVIQTPETAAAATTSDTLAASTTTSSAQDSINAESMQLPASVVAAGAVASLVGRLGLGATDLIQEHSLDGMRFRAFEPQDGQPNTTAVQQVAYWPLFKPGSEVYSLLVDLMWGVVPSFVWRSNRGVWTLREGRAARSRRLLRARQKLVAIKHHHHHQQQQQWQQ